MRRFPATLIALVGLVLAAGTAAARMSGPQGQSQVYTLADLVARQAGDPRAWSGRRVQVRAIAGGCIPWAAPKDSPCIDEGSELVDMRAGTLMAALSLNCGQDPPLPKLVRELPWVGRLLPVPQVLKPGTLAIYRIQLPHTPGYDGLLLQSLPGCGDE